MKKNDFLKKLLVNILDMIDFHNNQESPKSIFHNLNALQQGVSNNIFDFFTLNSTLSFYISYNTMIVFYAKYGVKYWIHFSYIWLYCDFRMFLMRNHFILLLHKLPWKPGSSDGCLISQQN